MHFDNSPDGEGESPTGGKLIDDVDAALLALRGRKPVEAQGDEGVRVRRERWGS